MIIDSHHHFFTTQQYTQVYEAYGRPDILKPLLKDFHPTDMKPLLDKLGVNQTVLIQMEETLDHTYDLLRLADEHPWVSAVIGWVDLKDPELSKVLDALADQQKFKGVRHPLEHEADPHWIMDDRVLAGLRELADRDYIFDLLVGPRHWNFLPRIAESIPDLSMVIEHFGRPGAQTPFSEWEKMMTEMAQYPQIHCKLSGLMVLIPEQDWENWNPDVVQPYVIKTIELFGADRTMYGSDWPVCTLAGAYEKHFEAIQYCLNGMSPEEKSQIFSKTASHVYQIS